MGQPHALPTELTEQMGFTVYPQTAYVYNLFYTYDRLLELRLADLVLRPSTIL